jgi:hypothetical protein
VVAFLPHGYRNLAIFQDLGAPDDPGALRIERACRFRQERKPVFAIAQMTSSVQTSLMLTSFTNLAYAFCAAIVAHGASDLVAVGYVSGNRCFVQVEAAENTTHIINRHDIGIEVIEDGAIVGIDALRFVIVKAPNA